MIRQTDFMSTRSILGSLMCHRHRACGRHSYLCTIQRGRRRKRKEEDEGEEGRKWRGMDGWIGFIMSFEQ